MLTKPFCKFQHVNICFHKCVQSFRIELFRSFLQNLHRVHKSKLEGQIEMDASTDIIIFGDFYKIFFGNTFKSLYERNALQEHYRRYLLWSKLWWFISILAQISQKFLHGFFRALLWKITYLSQNSFFRDFIWRMFEVKISVDEYLERSLE